MLELIREMWLAVTTGGDPAHIHYWSYLLLAVLVAVEGPVVTVLAATLAGAGVLDPWLVIGSATLGNVTADSIWYSLGRLGHFDRLADRVPWLRRFQPQIAQLEEDVQTNGLKFLFLAKLVIWPATIPTLIAAGMARVAWHKLLAVIVSAEVVWTGSLVVLGNLLGTNLSQFQAWMQWIAIGGMVVMVSMLPFLLGRLHSAASVQPIATNAKREIHR